MRFLWSLPLFCCFFSLAQALDLQVGLGPRDKPAVRQPATHTASLSAFNEEMAREICRRINSHCNMVYGAMGEILPEVEAGRIDLGFGSFLRTPEREERVDFSAAIWRSSSRLISTSATARRLAERSAAAPRLETLRDVRVVTIVGSAQQLALKKLAPENGLTLIEVKTLVECLEALREGKAEFCLLPMLAAYSLLSREQPGKFEFVGEPVVDFGLGGTVHIALPKKRGDLKRSVDGAIAEMRADGTFHRIVRRHFPFSLD